MTIEAEQTLCGNCKTKIQWKNGMPVADRWQAAEKTAWQISLTTFYLLAAYVLWRLVFH